MSANGNKKMILDLASVMATDTPANRYFFRKFNEVTTGMNFVDEPSRKLTRQIAYLFYLQGQAHARKWTRQ